MPGETFTSEIPRFRDCSPRGNKSKLPWAVTVGVLLGAFLQEPRNHLACGGGGGRGEGWSECGILHSLI